MVTKILPGTNIKLKPGARDADLSVTGVVAMALPLHWGNQVIVVNAGDNTLYSLGYKISDPAMELVQEIMNGAERLALYRLSTAGVKASAEVFLGVTAEAVFPGTRGSGLSIVIPASGEKRLVRTYLGIQEVNSRIISTVVDFSPCYVALSDTETPAAAIVRLTGDIDGAVESDYVRFFAELGKWGYNVIRSTDPDRVVNVVSFVKEQNANKTYVQGVATGVYPDNGNIYVYNSIDGVTADYGLMLAKPCAILIDLIVQAGVVNSLTYCRGIIGWTDVRSHLTRDQQISGTQNGKVLLMPLYDSPSALYDITSLTTFDEDHPKDFGKGLATRALQKYRGDLQRLLDTKCVGRIHDSAEGHARIKAAVFETTSQNYLTPGYIEDFLADDITVTVSTERDTINVIVDIKVVDTVDKIYITATTLQGGVRSGKNKVAGRVLRTWRGGIYSTERLYRSGV